MKKLRCGRFALILATTMVLAPSWAVGGGAGTVELTLAEQGEFDSFPTSWTLRNPATSRGSPGTAGWSGMFGGSLWLRVSGSPSDIAINAPTSVPIYPGDVIEVHLYHTGNANFASWEVDLGSDQFIASRQYEPAGEQTVRVTARKTYPAGTRLELAAVAWPGTFTVYFDYVRVEKQDNTPPVIAVANLLTELWPPNHKMVRLQPEVTVVDDLDPAPVLTLTIESDEPDDGEGDGDTQNDIVIHSPTDFELRAERSGKGDGRTYTLIWTAVDASGNSRTFTATVEVPKSRRGK